MQFCFQTPQHHDREQVPKVPFGKCSYDKGEHPATRKKDEQQEENMSAFDGHSMS